MPLRVFFISSSEDVDVGVGFTCWLLIYNFNIWEIDDPSYFPSYLHWQLSTPSIIDTSLIPSLFPVSTLHLTLYWLIQSSKWALSSRRSILLFILQGFGNQGSSTSYPNCTAGFNIGLSAQAARAELEMVTIGQQVPSLGELEGEIIFNCFGYRVVSFFLDV